MKGYLLDTNICIFYMKGRYQLDEKIAKVGQNRLKGKGTTTNL